MPHEVRTRIFMLLPIPRTLAQYFVISDVLDELERTSGGVTRTDYYSSIVWGQWFSTTQSMRIEDELVLIIADHPAHPHDPNIAAHLEQIKLDVQMALGQEIVWITTNEVLRISRYDGMR